MDGVRFKVGEYDMTRDRCADHPRYRAIRAPRSSCDACWGQWLFSPMAEKPDIRALGMALVLADLLLQEALGSPFTLVGYSQLDVADWLRACVTEALLSQEAE